MKILLAVDGSSYTKKMLAYLATHEAFLNEAADVTAFTVQSALPPRARAAVGKEVVDGYYADEAAKVLAPVKKFLARHGVALKTAWKVGPAGETIAKFADAGHFDLLMMGSHGNSALGNLVMGSVATRVLANCKVPVLLVR
ncbi:MAG: universal stress protein [Pseudomonadota bacterium]|nr:universal stress protein [Pseudomonadota bacterium]